MMIKNCVFLGNIAAGDGGGLHCDMGASPVAMDCAFVSNSGTPGGAVGAVNGSAPTLNRCRFTANEATHGAAVGCASAASLVADACVFADNQAGFGSAASCADPGTRATFTDCLFATNYTGNAGTVRAYDAAIEVERCTFVGNETGSGSGVSLYESSSLIVRGTTFYSNSTPYGVVICHPSSTVEMDNTLIAFNRGGEAFFGEPQSLWVGCCDSYANEGGDWTGAIAGLENQNGNFSLDPLFCGDENPEQPLTISGGSPCLPHSG